MHFTRRGTAAHGHSSNGVSKAECRRRVMAILACLAHVTEKRFVEIGRTLLVRVDRDEKLVDVAQTPPWLAGFEGTSNNESLGSLIVNSARRSQ